MQRLYRSDEAGVALLTDQQETRGLVALFQRVVCEQSWEPGSALEAYVESSAYLAVAVGAGLAGGLQLVLGSEVPALPILAVWPELDIGGRADAAELLLLAFRREFRGKGGLLRPLCVEMWRWCRRQGITEVWAEVTPANLRRYRRLGWPLEVMGPLRTHWGEPCFPCRAPVDEMEAETLARAASSERFRAMAAQGYRPDGPIAKSPDSDGDESWGCR